jgi:hypothetical protein
MSVKALMSAALLMVTGLEGRPGLGLLHMSFMDSMGASLSIFCFMR